jgi:hypothetical protein
LLGTAVAVAEGMVVVAEGMEAAADGMEAVADGMEAVDGTEAVGGMVQAVGMEGDGAAVVGMVVVGVAVGTGAVGGPAMVGVAIIRTIRTTRTGPGVIIRKDPRIT